MTLTTGASSDNPFNAQDCFVFRLGSRPTEFRHVAGSGAGAMFSREHSGPSARRFVHELLAGRGIRECDDIVHAFGPYFGRTFAAVVCDDNHVLLAGRRDAVGLQFPWIEGRPDAATASRWASQLLDELSPLPAPVTTPTPSAQFDEASIWQLSSDEYCVEVATQIRARTAALSQDGEPCDLVLVNHHYRLGVDTADSELADELMCVTADLGQFLWQSDPLPFPAAGHNTDLVDRALLERAGTAPELCSYALGERRTGDEFDRVLIANTWANPRGITTGVKNYARHCATALSQLGRDPTTGLATGTDRVRRLAAQRPGAVLHLDSPELAETGSQAPPYLMTAFARAVEDQVTASGGVTVRARAADAPTRLTAYLPEAGPHDCDLLVDAIAASLESADLTVVAAHAVTNGEDLREADHRARFALKQAHASARLPPHRTRNWRR